MAKQSKTVHKKSRGRPAGIKYGETIPARLELATVASLDAWAKSHDISRSEAIRRLVEIGLTVKTKGRPKSEDAKQRQDTKRRARELAGDTIDEMTETAASLDDQASRKRRLIKGPEEFQKVRRDRNGK
jgi:hypothetical protein